MVFSTAAAQTSKNDFWDNVRFGGGLGLSIGNNFTDIMIAPSAIYQFNEYFAAGVGLQGSYISVKDNYEAYAYGGSLLALLNPIEEIQLSTELEQLRVNLDFDNGFSQYTDNFWNTALFLGAGYHTRNVTIGVRYNVLHNNTKNIYSEAFMPFIRVYF
ncbi:MAG: hypothetical protein WCY89_06965 [Flavobacteriaceae bacterium]